MCLNKRNIVSLKMYNDIFASLECKILDITYNKQSYEITGDMNSSVLYRAVILLTYLKYHQF